MAQEAQTPEQLLVAIVNYRTPDLVINCLQSLAAEVSELGAQVVVADNDSGDGSVTQIQDAIATTSWQSWATVLPLERNGGFAYGNNHIIQPALASAKPPDYVLLLNPDTQIYPGALQTLLDFMSAHPEVGIAGSRLEGQDGTPQHSAFRFPSFWSELDRALALGAITQLLSRWVIAPAIPTTTTLTDWVSGACMIIRRAVFETVGLMDEHYFLYFEEVDFCRRAQHQGWSCGYIPQSRVIHFVGQSSGVNNPQRPRQPLPQYWFDSRLRYFLKHHGWLYTVFTDAASVTGLGLWKIRAWLQRKPDHSPHNLLQDQWRNSVWVRGVPQDV
ncbi:glycosyltransferase [Synechococcales cyanobacterium C]|uniref:Glycosyltransferase n=1 Tax=Petrachloros mirabilis ULC683 TaxID=2781853 RepID=A0A8K2A2S1_9CYAN|nr:glycosyltransferase family 2 protein [Petrachloros mirabilis]NCJ08587.1 glycosyltransferase [Petrachloros mirabilis ULC683]